jgi:hypothetical protein
VGGLPQESGWQSPTAHPAGADRPGSESTKVQTEVPNVLDLRTAPSQNGVMDAQVGLSKMNFRVPHPPPPLSRIEPNKPPCPRVRYTPTLVCLLAWYLQWITTRM